MVTSKDQFIEMREQEVNDELNLNAEMIHRKQDAVQIVSLTPTTKQQIKDRAQILMELVKAGEMAAMDLKIVIKAMGEFIKEFEETDLTRLCRDEAEKFGKKFDYKGATVELTEAGTSYDYKGTGDVVWQRLKDELDSRQKWLQSLKKPCPSVDPETGESFMVNPPLKKSTSTVKISLP